MVLAHIGAALSISGRLALACAARMSRWLRCVHRLASASASMHWWATLPFVLVWLYSLKAKTRPHCSSNEKYSYIVGKLRRKEKLLNGTKMNSINERNNIDWSHLFAPKSRNLRIIAVFLLIKKGKFGPKRDRIWHFYSDFKVIILSTGFHLHHISGTKITVRNIFTIWIFFQKGVFSSQFSIG